MVNAPSTPTDEHPDELTGIHRSGLAANELPQTKTSGIKLNNISVDFTEEVRPDPTETELEFRTTVAAACSSSECDVLRESVRRMSGTHMSA